MNTYVNTNTWEHQGHHFDRMIEMHIARILVIDDEASFRELVKEEFEERRFSVCGADGTLSVKDVVESFNPDLILLDLYMHGNRGWDILSACKECCSEIPVLIHTAYDSFSNDSRFCLADGLIVKSIHFEKLIKAVVAALRTRPEKSQQKNNHILVSSKNTVYRDHKIS